MANAFCQYLSGRRIRNSSYLLGLDKSTPLCSCPRAVINSPALCHNIIQKDLHCLDLWQNIIHHINDTNLIIILWQHPTPLCFTSVWHKSTWSSFDFLCVCTRKGKGCVRQSYRRADWFYAKFMTTSLKWWLLFFSLESEELHSRGGALGFESRGGLNLSLWRASESLEEGYSDTIEGHLWKLATTVEAWCIQ